MIEHIGIIILMALVASGAYHVQQDGMILERLGKFWASFLPSFWQKPFWTCSVCMVSVWGIPTALIVLYVPALMPLVYLFSAAGVAAYLNR